MDWQGFLVAALAGMLASPFASLVKRPEWSWLQKILVGIGGTGLAGASASSAITSTDFATAFFIGGLMGTIFYQLLDKLGLEKYIRQVDILQGVAGAVPDIGSIMSKYLPKELAAPKEIPALPGGGVPGPLTPEDVKALESSPILKRVYELKAEHPDWTGQQIKDQMKKEGFAV